MVGFNPTNCLQTCIPSSFDMQQCHLSCCRRIFQTFWELKQHQSQLIIMKQMKLKNQKTKHWKDLYTIIKKEHKHCGQFHPMLFLHPTLCAIVLHTILHQPWVWSFMPGHLPMAGTSSWNCQRDFTKQLLCRSAK